MHPGDLGVAPTQGLTCSLDTQLWVLGVLAVVWGLMQAVPLPQALHTLAINDRVPLSFWAMMIL